MSEFHFGLGRGRVSKREAARVDRIARRYGADFTCVSLPGEGPRYWFSCVNRGFPFDDAKAREVLTAVGEVRTMTLRRAV